MRRVFPWPAFLALSVLTTGCEDPNPPGMPKEAPQPLPEGEVNKFKNMNPTPKTKPTNPAPAKKA